MKIILEGISKKTQYTDKELAKIARGLLKPHGTKLVHYAVRFCKNGTTEIWAVGENTVNGVSITECTVL